jgi:2-oxoglutarate dehydrogenase complex dehydrogenase (E1) component-like enzyme
MEMENDEKRMIIERIKREKGFERFIERKW